MLHVVSGLVSAPLHSTAEQQLNDNRRIEPIETFAIGLETCITTGMFYYNVVAAAALCPTVV